MNLQPKTYCVRPKLYAKEDNLKPSRGFGLIEILVASAIISASLITLTAASQLAFRVVGETVERMQAQLIAEEGLESVRTLRDTSWSLYIAPLSLGVSYYSVFSTTTPEWQISSVDPGLISGLFTRTLVFSDVCRRTSDDSTVSCSSGEPNYVDKDTKKVVSQVVWRGNKTEEFSAYTTNMFDN